MNKYLSPLFGALLLAPLFSHAEIQNAAAVGREIPPSDANIRYIGRWDRSDPALANSYWGSAYLRVGFTGTSVKAKLANRAGMMVSIDGAPFRQVPGQGIVNLVAEPLPAGNHTLLLAASGQNAELKSQGFILDSGATTRPVPERPIIEFVGDSITACAGKGASADTNYAWMTGEALGCDHVQIAFSGVALVTGFGFFGDKTGFDQWYFQRGNCYHPNDAAWSFSYSPKLVVINLGTNDAKNGKRPSDAEFAVSYAAFLRAIRAKLPAAELVAVRPFGGFQGEGIRQAVGNLNAAGDKQVHFVDTTGWIEKSDTSDGIHPTCEGHAKVATRLTSALRPFLQH